MRDKLAIVNEKDEVIGESYLDTMMPDEIYRAASLLIENSKGQYLIAKRMYSMLRNPGLWGPAVEGTVKKGETYHETIIREITEEIGIKIKDKELKKLIKERVKIPYNHFKQWYYMRLDLPIKKFKIQRSEVQNIKWINKNKLIDLAKKDSKILTPSFKEFILKNLK